MIAIIRQHDDETVQAGTGLAGHLEQFRANIETPAEPGIAQSFLIQAIYETAVWWLAEQTREQKEQSRDRVAGLLDGSLSRANAILPYDPKRFTLLRSFVLGKPQSQ